MATVDVRHQKQTLAGDSWMSALCQKPAHALRNELSVEAARCDVKNMYNK
jgi:hypothetical protein